MNFSNTPWNQNHQRRIPPGPQPRQNNPTLWQGQHQLGTNSNVASAWPNCTSPAQFANRSFNNNGGPSQFGANANFANTQSETPLEMGNTHQRRWNSAGIQGSMNNMSNSTHFASRQSEMSNSRGGNNQRLLNNAWTQGSMNNMSNNTQLGISRQSQMQASRGNNNQQMLNNAGIQGSMNNNQHMPPSRGNNIQMMMSNALNQGAMSNTKNDIQGSMSIMGNNTQTQGLMHNMKNRAQIPGSMFQKNMTYTNNNPTLAPTNRFLPNKNIGAQTSMNCIPTPALMQQQVISIAQASMNGERMLNNFERDLKQGNRFHDRESSLMHSSPFKHGTTLSPFRAKSSETFPDGDRAYISGSRHERQGMWRGDQYFKERRQNDKQEESLYDSANRQPHKRGLDPTGARRSGPQSKRIKSGNVTITFRDGEEDAQDKDMKPAKKKERHARHDHSAKEHRDALYTRLKPLEGRCNNIIRLIYMHQGELRYSAASGRYKKVYGKPMKKHLSSHLRDFINNFIPDQVSMKFDGDTGDYMLRLKEPKKYVKKDVSLDFGEQMYPSVFKALGFCIDAEKAMKPFKFQKNKLPCPEFQRSSKCAYKDKCVFSHDHPPVKAMCKLFKLGECKKGDKCNDLHDHYFGQEPQEIKKKATHCRIYKYTGTCKFGDLCYYTHVEPEHVPQNDREMQAALEKMNADIQAEKAAKDVERITRECGRLVQLISTNKGRLRVKDIYELYKKTFGTGVYRNMKTGPVNFAMMHCPDKVDLWKNEEGLLHLILPDMITEEEGESTAAPKKKTNEPMKWMISVDKCGMIRDCLDELKQSTGANIRVATEYDMPPGSDERLVTIRGDPTQCQAALDYIKDKAGGKPYIQSGWKSISLAEGDKGVQIAKAIALSGMASRRRASIWVKDGDVKVNGLVEENCKRRVQESDTLTVRGEPVNFQLQLVPSKLGGTKIPWETPHYFSGPHYSGAPSGPTLPVSLECTTRREHQQGVGPTNLPLRPGKNCSFYMKSGKCSYGSKCKFNHPPQVLKEFQQKQQK